MRLIKRIRRKLNNIIPQLPHLLLVHPRMINAPFLKLNLHFIHQINFLFPYRFPQNIRISRTKIRQSSRQLHNLFLINHNPISRRQNILSVRMRISRLILPMLPIPISLQILHRTRTIKCNNSNNIIKTSRLHTLQGLPHSLTLYLKNPNRLPLATHLINRIIVHRNILKPLTILTNHVQNLLNNIQSLKPQKIKLHQTISLNIRPLDLRNHITILSISRYIFINSLLSPNNPTSMNPLMTNTPLKPLRNLKNFLMPPLKFPKLLSLSSQPPVLLVIQTPLYSFLINQLSNRISIPKRNPKNPHNIFQNRLRRHRPISPNHRNFILTILLPNIFQNNILIPKINIKIRQRNSIRI